MVTVAPSCAELGARLRRVEGWINLLGEDESGTLFAKKVDDIGTNILTPRREVMAAKAELNQVSGDLSMTKVDITNFSKTVDHEKEKFGEMVNKKVVKLQGTMVGMDQTMANHKGGVGKTTVSLLLAKQLAADPAQNVLVVDCSLYGDISHGL